MQLKKSMCMSSTVNYWQGYSHYDGLIALVSGTVPQSVIPDGVAS